MLILPIIHTIVLGSLVYLTFTVCKVFHPDNFTNNNFKSNAREALCGVPVLEFLLLLLCLFIFGKNNFFKYTLLYSGQQFFGSLI
jgi:hypothetical protein